MRQKSVYETRVYSTGGQPHTNVKVAANRPNHSSADIIFVTRCGLFKSISRRELLAKETPAVQAQLAERVEELRREVGLSQLRAELNVSPTELAMAMGIK